MPFLTVGRIDIKVQIDLHCHMKRVKWGDSIGGLWIEWVLLSR